MPKKADGHEESFTGTLKFATKAHGSKQEHRGPVFETDEGEFPVYVVGDNPFEHKLLKSFDGMDLTICGKWRRGTFRIHADGITPAVSDISTKADDISESVVEPKPDSEPKV